MLKSANSFSSLKWWHDKNVSEQSVPLADYEATYWEQPGAIVYLVFWNTHDETVTDLTYYKYWKTRYKNNLGKTKGNSLMCKMKI